MIAREGVKSPAIIVVGEVATRSDAVDVLLRTHSVRAELVEALSSFGSSATKNNSPSTSSGRTVHRGNFE